MLKYIIDGIEYEMPENLAVLNGPIMTLLSEADGHLLLNGTVDSSQNDGYVFLLSI